MNKKLMSALFVGALLLGSTSTLSSCKDYDDDIQANTDAIASLKKELNDKISTLENSVKDVQAAKDSAAAALKTAQDALAAAQGKADSATVAALEKRVADLESQYKTLSDAVKKLQDGNYEDRLAKVEKDLAAAIAAINAGTGGSGDLTAIQKVLDDLETELADIIGHRLTSVVFVAKNNINGIPAIKFESLSYEDDLHWYDRKNITTEEDSIKKDGKIDLQGNGNNMVTGVSVKTVEYTLNPAPFVKAENITMPYFNCMVAENDIELTRVSADSASVNSPIMPEENQTLTVDENGVLKLKIKKSITNGMNKDWVNNIKPGVSGNGTERFYMAQLVVPIAKAQWTTAETEAPKVVSDWARISESTISVYIENAKAGTIDPATANLFPVDKDSKGNYVHYHDSLTAYDQTSIPGRVNIIDHVLPYNKATDLDTLVRVCNIANHNEIEDYKALGLAFRYHVADGEYIIGANATNEQRFAQVKGHYVNSVVYDTLGVSQTSVGRQPIITADLMDTVNTKLVCRRYIKIKWAKDVVPAKKLPSIELNEWRVSCGTIVDSVNVQKMNEQIYHVAKAGGMTKEEFHTIYTTMEIKSFTKDKVNILTTPTNWNTGDQTKKDSIYYGVSGNGKTNYMLSDYPDRPTVMGSQPYANPYVNTREADVVAGLLRDANDNTSFILVTRLDPKAIGTVKKDGCEYELTVVFKDATGVNGDIEVPLIIKVGIPSQNFAYQGTYWKDGSRDGKDDYDTYNINPMNYRTLYDALGTTSGNYWDDKIQTSVPQTGLMTTSAYSQIRTDLINGYINKDTEKKPTNVGQLIQEIRECAQVSMVFDDSKFGNYSYLANYTVQNTTDANGYVKSVLRDNSISPTELWSNATTYDGLSGTPSLYTSTETTPTTSPIYYQKDAIAGWIDSSFGVTSATNVKVDKNGQLPYYNMDLGTKKDECSAVIQLAETNRLNGTKAARKLIGKKVPVKLVVQYNEYNRVAEDEFEVLFIEPLKVENKVGGSFIDNVYDGSWIRADEGFTMTDWNKIQYIVSAKAQPAAVYYKYVGEKGDTITTVIDRAEFAEALYHFYGVQSVTWDLSDLKTNLQMNAAGTAYVATDGVTTGNMPTSVSLQAFAADKTTNLGLSAINPAWIVYKNNDGTPVNKDYTIFVKTSVSYKWGTMDSQVVKLVVGAGL